MERDSFVFRKKWYEALKDLDAETKAQAFDAICHFAFFHDQVEVSGMVKMAMAFIMPELTDDYLYYEQVKKARSEARKKGNAKRWDKSQNIANIANATNAIDDNRKQSQDVANIADYVSSMTMTNVSFLAHMCAGSEEKKEEFLFEIGKEMLRKGAAKPSKEAESYIAYNDSQGWALKNGRKIADPVAWSKNWTIKSPNTYIARSAETYIRLLEAAKITDRKMLDYLNKIYVEGDMITLQLTTKKAVEAFSKAEEENIERMKTALLISFPEIKNPQLTYSSPR